MERWCVVGWNPFDYDGIEVYFTLALLRLGWSCRKIDFSSKVASSRRAGTEAASKWNSSAAENTRRHPVLGQQGSNQ